MSHPSGRTWSNDPYAPQISYKLYYVEKVNMCGIFVAAIIYGVILVLFFRCMSALLNPAGHRKEGIRWGLVAHTVAMFVFLTINVCINFALQSISYVDDREFSGGSTTPRGPYGYQAGLLRSNPMNSVPNMMFYLNLWLADGLLLYRCYIIYSSYWIVAFPFLLYLTSIATCIMSIIQLIHPDGVLHSTIKFPLVSYPATLSLTILLTLMIIIRLTLHGRNIQRVLGSGSNGSGLYKTIVTALIESYALYALTFIVWLALSSANNPTSLVFAPILLESQVIAPFLVILRVSNRRALAGGAITPRNIDPIVFKSQGSSTGGSGTVIDEKSTSITGVDGDDSPEHGPRAESVADTVVR